MSAIDEVPRLVHDLYRVVAELESLFPGRHLTPDGHLVGSLGEVLAAQRYGLELLPAGAETHDARAPGGTLVQIKATQRDRVSMSSEPERLIVLKLNQDGTADVVYNGPGRPVWDACGRLQKNGQRHISLKALRGLTATEL
jgi:hypothetical protein